MEPIPQTDYDGAWKRVLESELFPDSVAFLFPEVYALVDWSQGYVFLDKEFQRILPEEGPGRRIVDKLVRVTLLNGEEEWVLLHFEVQNQTEQAFEERLFFYFCRIFATYQKKVATLAVLGDANGNWRPTHYGFALGPSKVRLDFAVVKLLDFAKDGLSSLERDESPFALVVLAHLMAQKSTGKMDLRLRTKRILFRLLRGKGYTRLKIEAIFLFIDWIIRLPEQLDFSIKEELNSERKEVDERPNMSVAQLLKEEAFYEMLQVQLAAKFGDLPDWVSTKIYRAREADLRKWSVALLNADSLESVFAE